MTDASPNGKSFRIGRGAIYPLFALVFMHWNGDLATTLSRTRDKSEAEGEFATTLLLNHQ